MAMQYVHGYSGRETQRLEDQAGSVRAHLHEGLTFGPGRRVLEIGCGTGAQTVSLAANSPQALITSVDVSEDSLRAAAERVAAAGYTNVTFRPADLYDLPFEDGAFDDLFVCFVLEHLTDPAGALKKMRRVLKSRGTLTVFEGDDVLFVAGLAFRANIADPHGPHQPMIVGAEVRFVVED